MLHNEAFDKGTLTHPFLEESVAKRLETAARLAKSEFGVELLVLDALRTRAMESAVRRSTTSVLRDEVEGSASVVWALAENEVFAHGTGGAVDVTLMKDGQVLWPDVSNGAATSNDNRRSDEENRFSPLADADGLNKAILGEIMSRAGFVRGSNNWWHYEYGTKRWGATKALAPFLLEVVNAPAIEGAHSSNHTMPHIFPTLSGGLAQAFPAASDRAGVLGHDIVGHNYARNSHPTNEGLQTYLKNLLGCERIGLVQSGLAASVIVLKGLMPKRGTIIHDCKIYYESHRAIIKLADDFDWKVISCDLQVAGNLDKVLVAAGGASVVYLDNPRNWFLDTLDIKGVSECAHRHNARVVVDSSLQPLQRSFAKGSDVEVFSLSKYPSNGLATGGAYVCNDEAVAKKIAYQVAIEGHILDHAAAFTVWEQCLSLHDRLAAVSEKAKSVAAFLASHPAVREVRQADSAQLEGMSGGQITFHLKDASQGRRMEDLVSSNILAGMPLNLITTFGAAATTFEHFASNVRYREGIPREATSEVLIPDDIVRLGIGLEGVDKIIDALRFVLNMSMNDKAIALDGREQERGEPAHLRRAQLKLIT